MSYYNYGAATSVMTQTFMLRNSGTAPYLIDGIALTN